MECHGNVEKSTVAEVQGSDVRAERTSVGSTRAYHLAILTTTPPPPPSILAASRASAARLPALIDAAREREQAEAMAKLKQVGDSFLGLFGMSTDNFKLTKNEGGGYSVGFQK
ncbi:hypothetical protein M427DRAFT_402844 [Gonapodya prolifera JEL478]|uniref:Uncharacterized protein n=1 Tax=Gonapodya prolifera (strain JEL478) TaxID=1344416 RepID=A0A139ATV8_GONPJ|nr:hypothetical protein M427DRAFT_402844 [Gonapodya prolifera JEL478]|eukprot:KXS20129.1 hypothetical protein M427DRAFT_402844 [Gonapodya prolifera JEL478]